MEIKIVTITGADDNTNHSDMINISKDFPFVEWGILFSSSRQGSERYPSIEWVNELMNVKNAKAHCTPATLWEVCVH